MGLSSMDKIWVDLPNYSATATPQQFVIWYMSILQSWGGKAFVEIEKTQSPHFFSGMTVSVVFLLLFVVQSLTVLSSLALLFVLCLLPLVILLPLSPQAYAHSGDNAVVEAENCKLELEQGMRKTLEAQKVQLTLLKQEAECRDETHAKDARTMEARLEQLLHDHEAQGKLLDEERETAKVQQAREETLLSDTLSARQAAEKRVAAELEEYEVKAEAALKNLRAQHEQELEKQIFAEREQVEQQRIEQAKEHEVKLQAQRERNELECENRREEHEQQCKQEREEQASEHEQKIEAQRVEHEQECEQEREKHAEDLLRASAEGAKAAEARSEELARSAAKHVMSTMHAREAHHEERLAAQRQEASAEMAEATRLAQVEATESRRYSQELMTATEQQHVLEVALRDHQQVLARTRQEQHRLELALRELTEERDKVLDLSRALRERAQQEQRRREEAESEYTNHKSQAKESLAAAQSKLKAAREVRFRLHVIAMAATAIISLRPFLGMTFMSEEADGTLLESVTSGYAAFSAGLRAGDVICKLNGKVTRRKADFYATLYGTTPGDVLNLQVYRKADAETPVKEFVVHMGANGYTLQQVLALRRLAAHGLPVARPEEEEAWMAMSRRPGADPVIKSMASDLLLFSNASETTPKPTTNSSSRQSSGEFAGQSSRDRTRNSSGDYASTPPPGGMPITGSRGGSGDFSHSVQSTSQSMQSMQRPGLVINDRSRGPAPLSIPNSGPHHAGASGYYSGSPGGSLSPTGQSRKSSFGDHMVVGSPPVGHGFNEEVRTGMVQLLSLNSPMWRPPPGLGQGQQGHFETKYAPPALATSNPVRTGSNPSSSEFLGPGSNSPVGTPPDRRSL